jgi:hypothetical protein
MLILSGLRLRAFAHCVSKFMLAIRLYIFLLTSLFLLLVVAQRGLGILEAIVITSAMLFLILDVRTDLQALKSELQLLKEFDLAWSSSFSLPANNSDAKQQPKG